MFDNPLVPVAIAISLAVAGVMVVIVSLLRRRCPACRKPTLELDLRDSPSGVEAGTGAAMFQCRTCSAEFRCLDKGPLVPRLAWEAGARDELPRAKVLTR